MPMARARPVAPLPPKVIVDPQTGQRRVVGSLDSNAKVGDRYVLQMTKSPDFSSEVVEYVYVVTQDDVDRLKATSNVTAESTFKKLPFLLEERTRITLELLDLAADQVALAWNRFNIDKARILDHVQGGTYRGQSLSELFASAWLILEAADRFSTVMEKRTDPTITYSRLGNDSISIVRAILKRRECNFGGNDEVLGTAGFPLLGALTFVWIEDSRNYESGVDGKVSTFHKRHLCMLSGSQLQRACSVDLKEIADSASEASIRLHAYDEIIDLSSIVGQIQDTRKQYVSVTYEALEQFFSANGDNSSLNDRRPLTGPQFRSYVKRIYDGDSESRP